MLKIDNEMGTTYKIKLKEIENKKKEKYKEELQ
jgi:hypothetical protein